MAIPTNSLAVTNQVMNELGRSAVSAASDDPWALVISQRLPMDLTYLLQQTQWNFANKFYYSNSPNLSSPSPQWNFSFSLPPDFLNFQTQYINLWYQVIGNAICANQNFIEFFYIRNITDFTVFPSWFIQLLVYYTAWKVAKPLTLNTAIAAEEKDNFIREMASAKWQNISLNPVCEAPYNKYDRGGAGYGNILL